jgi:hypothetical protein
VTKFNVVIVKNLVTPKAAAFVQQASHSTNFQRKKNSQGTNALAYFGAPSASATEKNRFITFGLGVNVIKLVSSIADNKP